MARKRSLKDARKHKLAVYHRNIRRNVSLGVTLPPWTHATRGWYRSVSSNW